MTLDFNCDNPSDLTIDYTLNFIDNNNACRCTKE